MNEHPHIHLRMLLLIEVEARKRTYISLEVFAIFYVRLRSL